MLQNICSKTLTTALINTYLLTFVIFSFISGTVTDSLVFDKLNS